MTKQFSSSKRLLLAGVLSFTAAVRADAQLNLSPLSNLSYGSFAALGTPYVADSSLYLIGRVSATDQEWCRFVPSTGTFTQLTNDHYDATGATIFRAPVRIGNNVFVASAKPASEQDIEFSRFDLTTRTEQWQNLYAGYYSTSPTVVPNSSDPIVYGLDSLTGRVYFNPLIASQGNQLHYWTPGTNTITKLTSINGTAGISQNSSSGIVVIGDTVYTVATISGSNGLLKVHKTNGGYQYMSPASTGFQNPRNLTVIADKLYFAARYNQTFPADDYNLYVYDPATGVTKRITSYTNTEADGNLSGFIPTPDGNKLFINVTYYNSVSGQAPRGQAFIVNTAVDTATYLVASTTTDTIRYFVHDVTPTHFYASVIEGRILSRRLYSWNHTTMVAAQVSGPRLSGIGAFTEASNGRFYFAANDSVSGAEMWELNPVRDTLSLITNINPSGNSNPVSFVELNGWMYFLASATTTIDREFYGFQLPAATPLSMPTSIQLQAGKAGDAVSLSWTVNNASADVDGYVPQVSYDGKEWASLPTHLPSKTDRYEATHYPEKTAVIYYRIQERRHSGSEAYSAVRILQFGHETVPVVVPNPSPIPGHIRVMLPADAGLQIVVVYDATGRMIGNQRVLGKEGGVVEFTQLSPGIYTVVSGEHRVRAVVQ